ncbi:type VI secretion system ImpA family N-terminal domain-containing protein [Massilia genomosp. 1]|uniref:type VI secretion system ImpA family N-terminal domain-containing protein n=1 Tax=Massilia genomosp. 1 TaxID=2609280 RepID=UPI0035A3B6E4
MVRLRERALTERSKDSQIAAWLGEAWIALDGLAGGVRATQLLQGLCERNKRKKAGARILQRSRRCDRPVSTKLM